MIKLFFAFYESQPSVMIKRVCQRIALEREGQKARRKAEREINRIDRPVYKLPDHLKQMLTAFTLILISLVSYSQPIEIIDSVIYPQGKADINSHFKYPSDIFWPVVDTGIATPSTIDTMPVLIFYGDTQTFYGTRDVLRFRPLSIYEDTLYKVKDHSTKWMNGWMIYKRNRSYNEMPAWDDLSQYLDADKKPLPSTYVIWVVKYLSK